MSLAQKYRKSLDQRCSMRFKTRHPDGDNYDGVVIHLAKSFIVIREVRDFDFDGIVVLPKRMVVRCRDGKYEACYNQILRMNLAIARLRVPRWLARCETIVDVLQNLMEHRIWPGVEILYGHPEKDAFYLGPIENVSRKTVGLKSYDAAGKWENTYSLEVAEIFRIEFDSNYCNHFNKYMQQSREPDE